MAVEVMSTGSQLCVHGSVQFWHCRGLIQEVLTEVPMLPNVGCPGFSSDFALIAVAVGALIMTVIALLVFYLFYMMCCKSHENEDTRLQPMRSENQELQDHHDKTGCLGEIKEYKTPENGEVKGYFCSYCKKEWLTDELNINPAPEGTVKPVDYHIVPMFCCLKVSDTGSFVQWEKVKQTDEALQPGDHVAWLRCTAIFHHAIVEKVEDDKITFIERSRSGVDRVVKIKGDQSGNRGYSPMYKVFYPEEVQQQNPPELVILRAKANLKEKKYHVFFDNCEHFATFCKTGSYKSNQIFQLKVSLRAWIRRFVTSFIHIVATVSFSQTVGSCGDIWLGPLLTFVAECIYLLIALSIIYYVDTPKEKFMNQQLPSCTRACRCASIKAVCQSALVVLIASLFSVFITGSLGPKRRWSGVKTTGCAIGLGILGGLIGNVVGFLLFAFFPYPCCRNEFTQTHTHT